MMVLLPAEGQTGRVLRSRVEVRGAGKVEPSRPLWVSVPFVVGGGCCCCWGAVEGGRWDSCFNAGVLDLGGLVSSWAVRSWEGVGLIEGRLLHC